MATQKTKSILATILRVVGRLNVLGGLIVGLRSYRETVTVPHEVFGTFRDTTYHPELVVFWIFAGLFSCLICFALAKCVQAATAYLNSLSPEDCQ